MPTYDFKNQKTGKIFEKMFSISDKEKYLKSNSHIVQMVSGLNIVSGVSGKSYRQDDGWKDNLSRIAEAHPNSNLAKNTLKRSVKEVKTAEVLKKHRRRVK
tara:strand:+ start:46 stop:348 length:303 start_codon:yes stop_codon:yes gene_type:complete